MEPEVVISAKSNFLLKVIFLPKSRTWWEIAPPAGRPRSEEILRIRKFGESSTFPLNFMKMLYFRKVSTFTPKVHFYAKVDFYSKSTVYTKNAFWWKLHSKVFINDSVQKHLREGTGKVTIAMKIQLWLRNHTFYEKVNFRSKSAKVIKLARVVEICKKRGNCDFDQNSTKMIE